MEFNGKIYLKEIAGIVAFIIPIKQNSNPLSLMQPQAVIMYKGQRVNIPVKCVYIENEKITFDGEGLSADLVAF